MIKVYDCYGNNHKIEKVKEKVDIFISLLNKKEKKIILLIKIYTNY